jgi:SNF2 family DNA or RNA helicase
MLQPRGDKFILAAESMARPQVVDAVKLIPGTVVGYHQHRPVAAVPINYESWRLLTNAGLKVEAPILSQYKWAGETPWAHQRKISALLSTSARAYDLSDMGVGKTRAALWASDFLIDNANAVKILVVAPLSTLTDVWSREIFRILPHRTKQVLHGAKAKRLKLLRTPATYYIINPAGVVSLKEDLQKIKWDIVIVDELADYRNAQTEQWSALRPLVANSRWAWGLTGSPTPNAPTDSYGQAKLLTPGRVPSSFRRFRNDLMDQITQFKWEPKKDANERVRNVMQPAIRFTREECHDLPELTYSTRTVEMTPMQTKIYNTMLKECFVDVKAGRITAVNEGVKIQKLLQISAGFAYDSNGKAHWVGGMDRLKELVSIVEQAERKCLVFSSYKWLAKLLQQVLTKAKYDTGLITGDVTKPERDKVFQSFREPNGHRVISAHPGTMAHGLTLTEANTSVWYGPTQSPNYWNQANARTHRPGQTMHTHIICMQSSDVERRAFLRLRRKQKMEGLLMAMFEGNPDE